MKLGIIASATLLTFALAGCMEGGASPSGGAAAPARSGGAAAPARSGAAAAPASVVNPALTRESLNDAVRSATGPRTNLTVREGAFSSSDGGDSGNTLNDAVRSATGPRTNLTVREGAFSSSNGGGSGNSGTSGVTGRLGTLNVGGANTGITSSSVCNALGTC